MSNEIEQTYTKYDDDDDFIDDTFEATKYDDSYLSHGSSDHAYPVPKRCRAIYDFQVFLFIVNNITLKSQETDSMFCDLYLSVNKKVV